MVVHHSIFPDIKIPSNISLPALVTSSFYEYGTSVAITDPYNHQSFTYLQLLHLINQVAAGFYGKGVRKGDVILVCSPNCLEYPAIMHGILSIGAIMSPVNPLYTEGEIKHQLKDTGARYVIVDRRMLTKIQSVVNALPGQVKEIIVLGQDSFDALILNDGSYPPVSFDPTSTVAVIPYSSGTTGPPKGVELTHYNLVANVFQETCLEEQDWVSHEIVIAFLPFFHVSNKRFLITRIFLSTIRWFTQVVMGSFDYKHFVQFIQDYKATTIPIVPPVMVLLAKDDSLHKFDTSNLKRLIIAAAPLRRETEEEVQKRFWNERNVPRFSYHDCCSTIIAGDHKDIGITGKLKRGSIGHLVPNMTIKIVDPETEKELGVGEAGEMWLKGPNVMKGYLNNPTATKNTVDQNGYLHSGDVVYVDKDGNYFVVDRIKELIKYKGMQVAPAELEALLLTHEAVMDAAVIAKPDLEAGEVPQAFVVLKKDRKVTVDDIIGWVEKHVAPHKKLRGGAVFVEAIPKSASGKILRRLLKIGHSRL